MLSSVYFIQRQKVIFILLLLSHLQETPLTPISPNYMDTAMMRTPRADSLMFQTPGRPDSSAHPGSTQPGKRPGSVTFQFPESTGKTFRQGMGTNVSLSTWGSDFSPTMYTAHGTSAQSPTLAQVRDGEIVYISTTIFASLSLAVL